MRTWHIEWTRKQTTSSKEEHFTGAFDAEIPALAIAQWAANSYPNDQIDAVYDPLKFGGERRAPEERAMAALGSVILLVSQTMFAAKNRRKHCDERAKLMSATEEKFCFELIAAINQAGIDYDDAVVKMKEWQESVSETIREVARGAFAAPSGKAVAE